MDKKVGMIFGLLILLAVNSLFFQGGSAIAGQFGEWEITTSFEIPGMPFAMPPSVVRQCLDEDAVPYQAQENEKCETISKNASGNSITWHVRCVSDDGPVEINGVTSYADDTMDSKVRMTGARGDMSMHMTGKKSGPCK